MYLIAEHAPGPFYMGWHVYLRERRTGANKRGEWGWIRWRGERDGEHPAHAVFEALGIKILGDGSCDDSGYAELAKRFPIKDREYSKHGNEPRGGVEVVQDEWGKISLARGTIKESSMAKKKSKKTEKKPKAPKPPKAEKPPKPDRTKRKEATARAVWKQTEAHRTTMGKLAALVDVWDDNDQKAEGLKESIGGLKGQIAEHRAEVRKLARECGSRDNPTQDRDLKSIAGLERDLERYETKLVGEQEHRQGAREAMKCAMADIRKIVKEGPGLFEKPEEVKDAPAGKAASNSSDTSKASPSTATTASTPAKSNSSTSNGTKTAPSKSQADSATSTPPSPTSARPKLRTPYILTKKETGEVGDDPIIVLRFIPTGNAIVADAQSGRGQTEVDPAEYDWKEVEPATT